MKTLLVMIAILVSGAAQSAAFSASDDVWPLMASPNPARFSTLTAAGGSVGVDTCPNVYQSLNGRLPAQITRIQGRLAFQLNPTLPGAAAAAAIAGQIQQAYLKNSIAIPAATAADLIRQNAMLNAIEDTSKIVGQKVNDPAAMVLAVGRAQAVAQQNATWLNYGKVAEQALPVFLNVVEAVTYAMFPLMVLLLLLTSGRETMLLVHQGSKDLGGIPVRWGIYGGVQISDGQGTRTPSFFHFMGAPNSTPQAVAGSALTAGGPMTFTAAVANNEYTKPIAENGAVGGTVGLSITLNNVSSTPSVTAYTLSVSDANARSWTAYPCPAGRSALAIS